MIHFTCVADIIADPSAALPAMLKMNRGGVMGTQFYFSVREIDGLSYVLLETKQWLDADADQDDLAFLLGQLYWMNPLFMRGWNYPRGVRMFFSYGHRDWEAQAASSSTSALIPKTDPSIRMVL
jgi:hypothetical protein